MQKWIVASAKWKECRVNMNISMGTDNSLSPIGPHIPHIPLVSLVYAEI